MSQRQSADKVSFVAELLEKFISHEQPPRSHFDVNFFLLFITSTHIKIVLDEEDDKQH